VKKQLSLITSSKNMLLFWHFEVAR